MGAYTGSQVHSLLIRDNSVIDAFPKSTPASGLAGYDRTIETINAMEGNLMLNLCVEAAQSGRTSAEPFPELEGRGR
jgi:hypothetical protein